MNPADLLALVGRLPGLLAISPPTLAARASTLAQMLQGVLPRQQQQQQQQSSAAAPQTASSWQAAADNGGEVHVMLAIGHINGLEGWEGVQAVQRKFL